MKRPNQILLAIVLSSAALILLKSLAAEPSTFQVVEFATIRWQGRDNTHLVLPNGKVEPLRPVFQRIPRPEGMDERDYYMNVAMNTVAKQGYEFAGMTPDVIVMKRPVTR